MASQRLSSLSAGIASWFARDPGTVGGIVGGRPMSEAPASSGNGCKFTATDQPQIDLSTPYPPYISQVVVTFNAPQPGLSEAQISQLFESARPADATAVPAGGATAYSSGGGSAVVARSRGDDHRVDVGNTAARIGP